jgi:uncharacterized alpha-E superfamily protein
LERSLFTARLLRNTVTHVDEDQSALLESLLEVGDSAMTYHARYFGPAHLTGVLELLLLDENNPRSLAFQLVVILNHLDFLPNDQDDTLLNHGKKIILGGLAGLRLADAENLASAKEHGQFLVSLDQLLDLIGKGLPQFSDQLTLRYFSHAVTARTLNYSLAVEQ